PAADATAAMRWIDRQQREMRRFFAKVHDGEADDESALARHEDHHFRVADRSQHAYCCPRPTQPGFDQVARHPRDAERISLGCKIERDAARGGSCHDRNIQYNKPPIRTYLTA